MTPTRLRHGLALLGMLLPLATPLGAQVDNAARRVTEAALADIAARYTTQMPQSGGGRRLAFDPSVLWWWWSDSAGVRTDTALFKVRRYRDSLESAQLARSLGATLLKEGELNCGVGQIPGGCAMSNPLSLFGIAVADPRISGDRATMIYRTIIPVEVSGRVTTGQSGDTHLVRLNRTNGTWIVRCTTVTGTDAPSSLATIQSRCPP